jgi:hypothetical protein
VGKADVFKQLPHLQVVFLSGFGFDSAADIDGIDPRFDGLDNIVRRNPPGQKHPPIGRVNLVPVEPLAGAAVGAGHEGVEQDRVSEIGLCCIDVLAVLDPDRLDGTGVQPPEGFAELGRFGYPRSWD